jgi:xylulokinase
MAAMLNGASPIAWWSKASGATISDLMSQAESAKSETWPLFLPYLTGERTPHNNAAIRGAFYGLEASTGRAEMTRAVIDAIAYSFCDARDALASAGSVIEQPAVIGGGARSDLLLQTIADALGTKLKRYEDAETGPAFGAARLAMIAAGASRLEDIATKPKVDKVFSPDPANADRHHRRLERYRALYAALKPLSQG